MPACLHMWLWVLTVIHKQTCCCTCIINIATYSKSLYVCLADHVAFSCDVSKEQEVQKTFETIQATCGNISYLVNSAGINRWRGTSCWQKYQFVLDVVIEVWTSQQTCIVMCLCLYRNALLLRTKPEDMVALLHTNLLGTMLTCRAALRSMLHTQAAAIVNIGNVMLQ